jgi:hypothetical protein
MSRAGQPRGRTAYLMGKQVIAERMYRHNLAAMRRARPGAAIYAR